MKTNRTLSLSMSLGILAAASASGAVTKNAKSLPHPSPASALPAGGKDKPLTVAPPDIEAGTPKTDREIARWERFTKEKPDDAGGWVNLAATYLQKSRETNDPVWYSRMDTALGHAFKLAQEHYGAMKLRSALHSSRHEFDEAIVWTEKAIRANPSDPLNYGTLGDIYAELGDYEKAEANYQSMIDKAPGRASYSRASYLQELYGDMRSARASMQMAIEAGKPNGEEAAWCYVHLGHLNFNSGFLPAAEKAYEAALAALPGYNQAYMGLGKARAAKKDHAGAIEMYEKALRAGPHHESLAALIELYTVTGRKEKAKDARDRLGILQETYRKNAMDIDFEVAEIDAEHGRNLPAALELAKEEVKTHGNVNAYDSLAWIAYLNGDMETARTAMEKAMSLGTQDPLMFYHAGKIREKLGDKQESIRHLNRALTVCPYFHVRYAPDARATVERLAQSLRTESRTAVKAGD
jgi:tetratricopeptide (TPR) repeat protein